MLTFDDKKKFRHALYSKISIFFLCIVVFFVGRATYRVYQKEKESEANLVVVESQFNELNNRDKALQSDITRLGSPRGIEQEIRDKFRVAKPGEEMALIVDSEATATDVVPVPSQSWWEKFKSWF